MAVASVKTYAQAFRFTAVAGGWTKDLESVLRLGGFEKLPVLPLRTIESMQGQSCQVARGIALDDSEEDLSTFVSRCKRAMTVFLCGRDGKPVKGFIMKWESAEWLPFDLDAEMDSVACERMMLRGCTYEELEPWR